MKKIGLFLGTALLSTAASATTIGVSAHPFTMKKQVVTTEFNNYNNDGAGSGISARYFNRATERVNFDAGFGITDGERSNRLFMGADIELVPPIKIPEKAISFICAHGCLFTHECCPPKI